MLILNLGAGKSKIEGTVSIDVEPSCKPDVVCNFVVDPLPYETEEVDKIYLFHTIEHIPKIHHSRIFCEIHRVLKTGGELYVSYPEFVKVAQNYIDNKRGQREFWEKTIYGRQLYLSDFHVALMYTPHFIEFLKGCGFTKIKNAPESEFEDYNTVISAVKNEAYVQNLEEQYRDAWLLPSVAVNK